MWKVVNDLGKRISTRENVVYPVSLDELNSFFVGDREPEPLHDARPLARISPDEQFYLSHVTVNEILEAVSSSHSNARGPDDISLGNIKQCLPTILPVLQHIFDSSLQSGVFPTDWKRAIIRPIPKCKTPSEPKDFRPISILCASAEILESVACGQIFTYMANRGLHDCLRSGFKKGHRTHTALVKVIDDIKLYIDRGEITLLIAVDFTRAFDLVNINLFSEKLKHIGFSDSACNWIYSYLSNRPQVTASSDGHLSSPVNRNQGVAQGSLCGPPFFSLFMLDLPVIFKHCKYHMYADDLTLYYSGPIDQVELILQLVNNYLFRLDSWSEDNGFVINCLKTKAMWLGCSKYVNRLRRNPPEKPMIGNSVIEVCDVIKVLGVEIDGSLSWCTQTANTVRKSYAALSRLRKHSNCLPSKTKLQLVKSLVFPYFDYCPGVSLNMSNELVMKLHRAKNAALRFATGMRKFEHITPVYKSLNIMPYRYRKEYLCLCLLASLLRTAEPADLAMHLVLRSANKPDGRRSSFELQIQWARTSCYSSSFRIELPRIWNGLPDQVRKLYVKPGAF